MDLDFIVAKAIDKGTDVSKEEKDMMDRSIAWAESEHHENLSKEELDMDIKKAFECISMKDEDGEFICVLIGHGIKGEEEKNYNYFWFVWVKEDGLYKHQDFTNKETVDVQLNEINMSNYQRNTLSCKRIINAMLNGTVVRGKHENLIDLAKKEAGENLDRLFTCIEHEGRVVVCLQDDCEDDEVDDHSMRYEWYIFNNIESKDPYMFTVLQTELVAIIDQPITILEDLSKEQMVA